MDSIIANIVIILTLCIIVCAVGVTVYSVYRSAKANKREKTENGVPVSLIGRISLAIPVVTAALTLLVSDVTNMCIITALVMLILATALLFYSKINTSITRNKK